MAKNWLDKYDGGGDVPSNKKGPTIYTTNTPGSYFDPVEGTIYLNKADAHDPSVLPHEMEHYNQWLRGDLRYKPGDFSPEDEAYMPAELSPYLPLRVPSIVQKNSFRNEMPYYNRRAIDQSILENNFLSGNPSFNFISPELVYNKVVNPEMYETPWTAEGEAEQVGNQYIGPYKKGGLIKRADGSYSRRGLWDNIRANKGSGRKPTAEMLRQERKIKKHEDGGWIDMYADGDVVTNNNGGGGGVGGGGKSPSKKYWTEKDVDAKYWKTFKEKYPYAIGVDPYHVDKDNNHLPVFEDNNHLPVFEDLKLTQSKGIVPIDNNSYDDELKPMTSIPFVPQKPIRKIVNPDFQESDYTEKHNSIVDPLGNPRYKYYNQDKVIGQNEYNRLKGFRDGSWIADSSLPTPTSPSYYSAGEDTTLSNYQMGTPKARMYGPGGEIDLHLDKKGKKNSPRITPQGFLTRDPMGLFIGGVGLNYKANDNLNISPYAIGVGNEYFQKFPVDYGVGVNYPMGRFNPSVRLGKNPGIGMSYKFNNGGPVMYNAGSTVWTNQDTPLWAAGTPTPTATQNFRNDRSLNTDTYRIGDVIATGMDYKSPAAGTYDYNKDIQPYHTMRLHAPDTTMMARHGGHITNKYKERVGIPYAISPGVSDAGMYVGPTTQRGITFANGGYVKNNKSNTWLDKYN
jgi:hypothetical protein